MELELKDGVILDAYSSPVVGKDDEHYGRIWTFRDMTEQRRYRNDTGEPFRHRRVDGHREQAALRRVLRA